MNDNEKFVFKTMQYYQSLGVTAMLVIFGFMANFIVSTSNWKSEHDLHHQLYENYYTRRIYIDSTNCLKLKNDVTEIKVYLNQLNHIYPKLEAILPKEEETNTDEINLEKW